MKTSKWTEEENNYLKEAYPKGICLGEMSKHLDRSARAIRIQVNNLGLKKKRAAKVVILDDNPLSIASYLEEYDDKLTVNRQKSEGT